jgi:hypothetical protein
MYTILLYIIIYYYVLLYYCLNTICAYLFSISSLPVVYVVTYKVYKRYSNNSLRSILLLVLYFMTIALHFFKLFWNESEPAAITNPTTNSTTYLLLTSHSVKLYPILARATETTFPIVAHDTETTSSCSVATLAPFRCRKSCESCLFSLRVICKVSFIRVLV